jgi:hypothetical protein
MTSINLEFAPALPVRAHLPMKPRACLLLVTLSAFFATGSGVHAADLSLSGTVTPLGASFLYELEIANAGPDDYSIVSIIDAPLNEMLIGNTLTTPAGFIGSYDGGLGIIDFLEDTQFFAAGTVFDGFSFQSAVGPALAFATFSALTTQGATASGDVTWEVRAVPEPSAGLTPVLALGLAFAAWSRRVERSRGAH